MARKVRPEDLTEKQLRQLLIAKRQASRQVRLARFRETGRLVEVARNLGTRETEEFNNIAIEEAITPPDEKEVRVRKRRRFADRALLFVEVAAILGLLYILLNGIGIIQQLNEQVTAALVQPTLTPTPLITISVLPSGHKPPTDPGGARPNFDEIPSHLPVDREKFLDSFYNLPIPTPSPEQATRIQVPRIGVDAPIVPGDGWEQLKKGVGQHVSSINPGQPGNLVLSAHNDVFGEIFRHLDELQTGDEIIVYTNVRAYTYVIDIETQIVAPTDIDVMDPTEDATVTLISCYPYLINNKRIVVKATLVDG